MSATFQLIDLQGRYTAFTDMYKQTTSELSSFIFRHGLQNINEIIIVYYDHDAVSVTLLSSPRKALIGHQVETTRTWRILYC